MRTKVQEAAVAATYRHLCNDAAAAAGKQDWAECERLTAMARAVEQAYPDATARARFACMDVAAG